MNINHVPVCISLPLPVTTSGYNDEITVVPSSSLYPKSTVFDNCHYFIYASSMYTHIWVTYCYRSNLSESTTTHYWDNSVLWKTAKILVKLKKENNKINLFKNKHNYERKQDIRNPKQIFMILN